MDVHQTSKREVAEHLRPRYLQATRPEKQHVLDEFVQLTGYHRKYTITLVRHGPTATPDRSGAGPRPGRRPVYGPRIITALIQVARVTGWICGKRLVAALPELVPAMEAEGTLHLRAEERQQLLAMSAATIDRRLARERRGEQPQGLATTKSGTLLKSQIPIRTYTPWDEEAPGCVEIDLVAHCGTSPHGEYAVTLTVVDIATGWTECAAIPNKGQHAVSTALQAIRARLPFPLLGIDSDNGSEFINELLLRYGQQEQITFTRCRAYHKNNQAHIEQKNYTAVRQVVGYDRLSGRPPWKCWMPSTPSTGCATIGMYPLCI